MEAYRENNENFIIVGNGAAGYNAAATIRKNNPRAVIKLISAETDLTYYRPQLSDYLSMDLPDKKFYVTAENWYGDNNIELLLGKMVSSIDKDNKLINLEDGSSLNYDKLILANGSNNFMPPVKGIHLQGVYTLKYKSDADKIKSAMKSSKNVIVIGGGLLGLEAAWEMKKSGLNVTVVEFFPRLLPRQLDDKGSELFKSIADKAGIDILLGDSAEEINADASGNNVASLRLKSGKIIESDIILFSVGIKPNKDIAEKAGILCNRGILVNENMETNIKDIYACGDVAEFNGIVYGNWAAALEMGKVVGKNVTGEESKFHHFASSTIFRALNTEIFSAGTIDFNDTNLNQLAEEDSYKGIYKKLLFKDGVLVGGILMGDTKKAVKILGGMKKAAGEEIVKDIF